jgi:hypothetical protein
MATITVRLGSSQERDANGVFIGEARIEYDVDDVALRILTLRYINGTTKPAYVKLWAQSDPSKFVEATIAPNTPLTSVPVPSNTANKVAITVVDGRVGGVEGFWVWPSA